MTIYEITSDYLQLMQMMEDPELDPQTLADTMEGIDGELEVKAENYGKVLRNIEGDIEALKSEEERLKKRRQTLENNAKRLKLALQGAMEVTGKTKFKTDLFSFSIRKNAPAVVIDADELIKIPLKYLVAQEPKIDKAKIKEDLKAGVNLDGVAHLESGSSLSIR